MLKLRGKSVFGGVVIGPLSFFRREARPVQRLHIADSQQEISRYRQAQKRAISQLQQLYSKALQDVGASGAAIFEIHQMLLEDPNYQEAAERLIRSQQVNAEYAVSQTSKRFIDMFLNMDDAYLRGRAADVKDVSQRLLRLLLNKKESGPLQVASEPVILAADDLVPSEMMQWEKGKVLGFVTMFGSTSSHAAILAQTMGLPAVVGAGVGLQEEYDGKLAVIDGFTGQLYIEPDEDTLQAMRRKQVDAGRRRAALARMKGRQSITQDGREIKIHANIGQPGEVKTALQNDAQGIGLFRSEFLYLQNDHPPTEEEQFQAYKAVAEQMAGREVVIRTLDIGADKQADYFQLPEEPNPALGFRAIRLCLRRPEIFCTQLRAICRASAFGNLSILLPLITSVQEIRQTKAMLAQVQAELQREGIAFDSTMQLGIMIETPAAAILSDRLAKEVDFFSIGTNDLTQYVLAADRQNPMVEAQRNPRHPAVLRLVRLVAENAHKAGIWVGICGELAADLELTAFFLSLQVDELSVPPACVLELRSRVRALDLHSAAAQEELRRWTE